MSRVAVVLLVALAALVGCQPVAPMRVPPPSPAPTAEAAPPTGPALDALAALPVQPQDSMYGYHREVFGAPWTDVDHNGCNTRDDILKRDLVDPVTDPKVPCEVVSGKLNDPYTGDVIYFQRGASTSSKVQIDHVVSLGNAWATGADRFTDQQRLAFANDPIELLAVEGVVNQQKGDSDASVWLPPPPRLDARCSYVARQIAVKTIYQLWITQPEHDAMAGVLARCPAQELPGA